MYFRWNEYNYWNSSKYNYFWYKASISSSPFSFFDYSYVGLAVTLLGIIFITFIGRNFILLRSDSSGNVSLINLKGYLFEVEVNENSNSIGMTLAAFKRQAGEDVDVIGIVNSSGAVSKVKNNTRIKANQILVIKTPPNDLAALLETFDFSIPEELHFFKDDDLEEIEVMITPGSRLIGRKHDFFHKIAYEELNLLGLWEKALNIGLD